MKRVTVVGVFAIWPLLVTAALAHEQSMHKGRATEGEVAAVSDKGLSLKTAKGTVPVTVSEKTEFERGDDKVTKNDIHQGDHVSVFGTVLADGELVAREIVIHPAGGEGKPHEHHDAD